MNNKPSMPPWYLECEEKERQMLKIYGQDYIAYQRRASRFFPKIGA